MIRVKMVPHPSAFNASEGGIKQVVMHYAKYLPNYGVEIVDPEAERYDLLASHAGMTGADCDVCHCHGLYWTADLPEAEKWQWKINSRIADAMRSAVSITVPTEWVAETIRRDLRVHPRVVPHGIDWDLWQHEEPNQGYILWNKNRASSVCNPGHMVELARRFPSLQFLATFSLRQSSPNVSIITRDGRGVIAHDDMKMIVQRSAVYLSTSKETFGIGILEAMASGVPVLGWAEGGNLDLVKHGVNGYLATAYDHDDLQRGLAYCLEHREVLGANGREMAKTWSWEKAVIELADVYAEALDRKLQPNKVSIIIPSFNYGDSIGRTIESAMAQTSTDLEEIIVVDDGSDDDGLTEQTVAPYSELDERVKYLRKPNGGVATARNAGIRASKTKYVCCLDADDALAPRFIETCMAALSKDPSLGIAYTGLHWIKPDGSEGESKWPGAFDYDAQLKRRNQIPTCCIFKREMWKRLGGYRQRYGPTGAGSEDAEFWTRAGAYGYRAEKVTDSGMFIYSWMSGHTSKEGYNEADWLEWHPFVKDGEHPFASIATPINGISHPVRQYDTPEISVIIPVGKGHESRLINALDSLEAQTFRNWEVIVVMDGSFQESDEFAYQGGFQKFHEISTAYPYVRWKRIENAPRGAGYARNRGADMARAPFLFFLDADDFLRPDALDVHLSGWRSDNAIIYSDYIGIASVDNIDELAQDLQDHVYRYDGKTAVIGYRSAEYDCERAQKQPDISSGNPYIWSAVTCLIPHLWHDEIGGFDEKMRSWEDIDYHWRMARRGKCYVRIPEELLVYNFETGCRRDFGIANFHDIVEYLKAKYESEDIMACGKCGHGSSTPKIDKTIVASRKVEDSMQDENFVMIEYMHSNRGQHNVSGVASGTRYGYRKGGDRFLVHRADVAAAPHLFRPFIERSAPAKPRAPIQSPVNIFERGQSEQPMPPDIAEAMGIEAPERLFDPQSLPGITPKIVAQMKEKGIASASDIVALGIEGLLEYKGVGKVRAETIMQAAKKYPSGRGA